MAIAVRAATMGDLEAIVAMGRLMIAEAAHRFPAVDPVRFRQHLDLSLARPEVFLVAIAESGAVPVGFVTAIAGDFAWSTEKRAVGDALYTRRGFRSLAAANRLLDHFEAWADGCGARLRQLGTTTGIKSAGFGRLLSRRGYAWRGEIYARDAGASTPEAPHALAGERCGAVAFSQGGKR